MPKPTGFYPPLTVDTTAKRVLSHAGAVLLVATAGKVGLDRALSAALAPWRKQWAVLDPGKILLDQAISVAIVGTAWPTFRRCAPSRRCSAGSLPTRRCPG